MTELFGAKTGTMRVGANLISEILEVRFRRLERDKGESWLVARSKDGSEVLVLLNNRSATGEALEPNAADYELLFYMYATRRPEEISRKLSSGTSFRFLDASERLRNLIVEELTAAFG